jgi:hypothetical protein
MVVISVKVRCEVSHLPFRSPDDGRTFAFRQCVYNPFTCESTPTVPAVSRNPSDTQELGRHDRRMTDEDGAPPCVRQAAQG